MNDLPHPLEGKDAARASARVDVQGMDRTLVELIEAFQNSGQTKSREVLLALARINRYIANIDQAINVLGDDPETDGFRTRLDEVRKTVDQIVTGIGEPLDELLVEAEVLLEEAPEISLEAWQLEQIALRERAQVLLQAMQELATELTERLGNAGGLNAGDFGRIENLLAEYDSLAVGYESAVGRFVEQQNVFTNEWSQAELLFRALTKRLGRLSGQQLIAGEALPKKEQEAEIWPPGLLKTTNDYLSNQDPIRHDLTTRLSSVAILRPGQTDDDALEKLGRDFNTSFADQEKKLRADVVTLAKLAAIAQGDQTVSITVRLERENEVSAVQARLEQFIANMNDEFEPLLWQKTLLFTVPEALALQINIDSYVQPTPATVDMAGYMELRTGVTGLEQAIQALVAAQTRITGGNTQRQQYLTSWIQGFNPNLTQRRDAAFQFWVLHLDTIHSAFNATRPNSLATAYATSSAIANLDAAGVDVNTLENRLTTALGDAKNEIATAVSSGQLPPDSTEPAYSTHLRTWWDKVATELTRLNTAKERKVAFDYVEGIRSELNAIKNDLLMVSVEDNQVEKVYTNIRTKYKEKVETNLLIPDTEKRKLEIEIAQAEYFHTRMAYIERMEYVEGKNLGFERSLNMFSNVHDVRLLPVLKQLISEIGRLANPPGTAALARVAEFQRDYADIEEDFRCRKLAHLSWAKVWPDVIGNNEKTGRTPPIGLNEDNFPLEGAIIKGLINHGTLSREFGGGFVGRLGRMNVLTESFDVPNQVDSRTINQTLFGFCMRTFDDVYSNRIKVDHPQYGKVTTRNIHLTYPSVVAHVYELAKQEHEQKYGRGAKIPFQEHDVLVAWRLHAITTLNISYLGEASPTMPDNFYYLFNWVDYCIKYVLDQTNSFDLMQTMFVFGYRGANPLEIMYSAAQLEEVRASMGQQGLLGLKDHKSQEIAKELWEREGYPSFNGLIDAPLIKLENHSRRISRDQTDPDLLLTDVNGNFIYDSAKSAKMSVFEPPLRFFLVRDASGKPKRFYDAVIDGKLVKGKFIRFEDMQTIDGQRLYEEMPFDQVDFAYPEYYNQIGNNAMWFLKEILKTPSADFLKKMDSPDFVKTLRNQVKYAEPYFSVVGADIREGTKRKLAGVEQPLGESVMNSVTNQLIMAKCLMETDTLRPKFWSISQVDDYLQELVRASAIISEVAEAIKLAVIDGRKWQIYGMTLAHKLQKQLEDAARVK